MAHPHASPVSDRPQTAPDYVRCLEVFVTNRCNMACANCCVDTSKNSGASARLEWADLKAALDLFMDKEQVPYAGQKTIVFAGGETLFEFPLIKQAVEYVQKFPLPPHVEVYTNGTVAKPEHITELRRWDATVIFSLDGDKDGHDAARKLAHAPGLSAFEEIMSRLENIPKAGCATNTVIRPENLEGLVDAFDEYAAMGFKQIDMWLDYLHVWTPEQTAALEVFMGDFRRYYAGKTRSTGTIPFMVPMINHALYNGTELARGRVWWRDCFRLIMGADGHFYDCEGALLLPYKDIQGSRSVNRASEGNGVDWAARQAIMDEAEKKLKTLDTEKNWQYVCPRLYCTAMGLLGKEPDDAIANLHSASEIFLKGFVELANDLKENESFKRTYLKKAMDTPG